MPRVFVSIGSNINREENIRSGVAALRARFDPLVLSNVYESEAVGFDGDNFYNLVAAFDADKTPAAVIAELRCIENGHGRVKTEKRFNSRALDLDILLYGNLVQRNAEMDIPRGDIVDYAFILIPLVEITGELRHPESGLTYQAIAEKLDPGKQRLWKIKLELCSNTYAP